MRRLPLLLLVSLLGCGSESIDDDFWVAANPSDEGVDEDTLNAALSLAAEQPNLYSVVVIRNGRIVGEHYGSGRDAGACFCSSGSGH